MPPPALRVEEVVDLVGPAAFTRGLEYAHRGRVRSRSWDAAEQLLDAVVAGSAPHPYVVRVRFRGRTVRAADCTCPVGGWCKHVAAALLQRTGDGTGGPVGVAGAGTAAKGPAGAGTGARGTTAPVWSALLDGVLAAPPQASGPARTVRDLALLVEVQDDPAGSRLRPPRPRRLAARPAVRSDRGGWVRTGAAWSDVLHGYALTTRPEQRAALRALHRVTEEDTPYRWGATAAWIALDRAPGPLVWAALEELGRLGVPLVAPKAPFRPVTLLPGAVRAVVDLREVEGELVVQARLLLPDGTAPEVPEPAPEALGLVGAPEPVAAYWIGASGDLVLARLDGHVDRRAESLLTLPSPLRVTGGTTDAFWSGYAPRLAAVLPLTSSDTSVRVPSPARCVLRLELVPGEDLTVAARWTWAYRGEEGGGPPAVPVGPLDRAAQPWRRVDDEARVLAATSATVDAALAAAAPTVLGSSERLRAALVAPLLVGRSDGRFDDHADGRSDGAVLQAWDGVTLAGAVLPALADLPDVEVRATGPLPEFREASAPVEVHVRTSAGGTDDGRDDGTDDASGSATDLAPGAATDVTPGPVAAAPRLGGDRDWFDLSVTLRVDGRDLPLARVLTAMAAGQDRVMLDDGLWARVDGPAFEALRALLAEARALDDPRRAAGLRVSRYDVSAWDELEAVGVVVEQARAWRSAVERLATLADPSSDVEVPPGVAATLRPYQRAGYAWLRRLAESGLGGVLADDMGLGKTLQVLTFATWYRTTTAGRAGPVLVVAPTSVVGAWASEAARFVPDLVVRTVEATAARRGTSLAEVAAGADVVVTSYALFRLEADEHQGVGWSALVLDEAQTLKNHASRGYAAARTLPAPLKVAITGTPLENSVLELWALLGLVAPGLLPSLQRFTERYRTPIEREGDTARLADLRRRIRPFLLRRTKEDVAADLPPRLEHVVEVELAPRHRALYDRYLARERQKVLGLLDDLDGNRFAVFRSLTLLRRLALDPSLVDERHAGVPASKLDHLAGMLEEIVADGHRVLVFSQFTSVLGRVRERLDAAGTAYAYLDGATRRRPEVVERFRSGNAPVFLISLKAGGAGLTLTEADYVVVLDPWWNPAVEAQAVDRAHRIGQTRQVMVYRLVAAGTIEDKVMALKGAKAALFASVLGGEELTGGRLTAADVRTLLDAGR
ncbi:DEAD/DEAH box helicase [Cellulomonas marina]|nr:DEAD/DEAH box helicase [Cellulomonas marina]